MNLVLMSAHQEVVLGSNMGLFVLQLEHLYTPPRFFAHSTPWEVADIQWNPHMARSAWVASTVCMRTGQWLV